MQCEVRTEDAEVGGNREWVEEEVNGQRLSVKRQLMALEATESPTEPGHRIEGGAARR